MAFIKIVPEEQAEGLLKEQYDAARAANGYVPNHMKAFSLRPEVYDAWTKLQGAIRANMRLRRYELVVLASAMALGCRYWMLAHGALLRKNFFSAPELVAIVKDFRDAGLAPDEVAVMSFAQKISTGAHEIDEADIEELRSHGLSDEEILDVVLASAARNFFSKTLDALGMKADEKYRELEPELVEALLAGEPSPW